jgi:hypothetical protein
VLNRSQAMPEINEPINVHNPNRYTHDTLWQVSLDI